jgi:hypothetical protein
LFCSINCAYARTRVQHGERERDSGKLCCELQRRRFSRYDHRFSQRNSTHALAEQADNASLFTSRRTFDKECCEATSDSRAANIQRHIWRFKFEHVQFCWPDMLLRQAAAQSATQSCDCTHTQMSMSRRVMPPGAYTGPPSSSLRPSNKGSQQPRYRNPLHKVFPTSIRCNVLH